MSGELERRWDDAVETAWREFRQRLADRLASLEDDEHVVVELAVEREGGAAPYCQALAGQGWLRVEAVSNVYLADELALDVSQDGMLKHLGFAEPEAAELPGATNYWTDLEQREADRAAVMMVRALREVYAVVHPTYLVSAGLSDEQRVEASRGIVPPMPRRGEPDPDEPMSPQSPDQVREAVELAVGGLYDELPAWDEDGDLPLDTKRGVVWVTVGSQTPRVLLHAPLVSDVVDEERALLEVNLLNRREFGLTFSVQDGHIRVTRELDVRVVVPAQLGMEMERLVTQVDVWASDLVDRVGGRCMNDQTTRQPAGLPASRPTDGRFATAYGVMVELERAQRGSVGPATMARIFENDTGLLLKAVRINEQRRREMRSKVREARDQGRSKAEQVARARQEYLRELTARMRAALRLLVDAPVRKVQLDQLALFDEDEAGSGR
ncbi:TY-Chap domain-containing protein [Nocardioides sediminis]|uniref:TY-Chap domain-containing protein n=1 Tax=Nocardioides sediminis TaxID=433648 RepID=UPI000D2FA09D|nr:hypothetical protein [Nocardioides sediminis]